MTSTVIAVHSVNSDGDVILGHIFKAFSRMKTPPSPSL
jgi:hypothetical protein